jgi:predicted molibdopterin-dependent oxidoreductase YjgC
VRIDIMRTIIQRVFGNRLNALMDLTINGSPETARSWELLIEVINRGDVKVPQVCYHPQLGPIQACDTCMVEVDGKLVKACATHAAEGMSVNTSSPRADAAQREAFDRILGNHLLYCTVCDNNNGNCTVHNTTILLRVEHQKIPYQPKPYEADMSNPFYRYDPTNASLAGAVFKRVRPWVQLTSRYGKVRAQAVITARVQGNELYMSMNSVNQINLRRSCD